MLILSTFSCEVYFPDVHHEFHFVVFVKLITNTAVQLVIKYPFTLSKELVSFFNFLDLIADL